MHSFEFHDSGARGLLAWDRYKSFHRVNGPFVEFDDGALGIHHLPAPRERKHYERYGITLLATTDKASTWPTLYADDRRTQKVAVSRLSNGYYAYDHDQRTVVLIDGNQFNNALPGGRTRLLAYWVRPHVAPINLRHIRIDIPDTEAQAEFTPWAKEFQEILSVRVRLDPELSKRVQPSSGALPVSEVDWVPVPLAGEYSRFDHRRALALMAEEPYVLASKLCDAVMAGNRKALSQLQAVSQNGFVKLSKVQAQPCLFVKSGG